MIYSYFLIIIGEQQDLNLRLLEPQPNTLPLSYTRQAVYEDSRKIKNTGRLKKFAFLA
jgi:hypothetical protein